MENAVKRVPALGILVSSSDTRGQAVWYLKHNHKKQGPFSWNQLKLLAAHGHLLPTDLLWRPGLEQWVAAATVKDPPSGSQAARKMPPRTMPHGAPATPATRRWSLIRWATTLTFLLVFGFGVSFLLTWINDAEAASASVEPPVVAAPGAADVHPAPKAVPAVAVTAASAPKVEAKPMAVAKAPPMTRTIPVTGGKLDATTLARLIDQEVQLRLAAEGIKASPVCDDSEFIRRVYLDIVGVIPPADRVVAFLDSKDPGRRSQLIEELLANPLFGKQMSEAWTGLMVPRESNNRRLQSEPLRSWLERSFNANKPWNKLVYELVSATGEQDKNGAVTFFIGNPGPDKVTDAVTRLFMGVQLQCAQCHNHPFTGWKQNEYWAMAAFFMKVNISANPQMAAKNGISPAVSEATNGKGKGKAFKLPDSAKVVPAKFLQGEQPKLKPATPLRPILADWMTSPKNRFFARAMVNRMWASYFGRGLVNPVDDMHDENEPSHPELLAALTEQFKASGFDVKYLIRAICNSETYQRTSRPSEGNGDDRQLFSHMPVRALAPEHLYDSLVAVLGNGPAAREGPRPKAPMAAKKGPGGQRDQFTNFFRIDEGANPLDYQAGIPQALRLMNSGPTNNGNAAVAAAMAKGNTPPQVIERLYLMALARRPTDAEARRLAEYVGRQTNTRAGYADVLWALVNSSEFTFNH
jgi:hypothetical protein